MKSSIKWKTHLAIPKVIEEGVEQIFETANINGQGRICSVVHNSVEHVILDPIPTPVPRGKINKPVDKYFEVGKASRPLEKCSVMTSSSANHVVHPSKDSGCNCRSVEGRHNQSPNVAYCAMKDRAEGAEDGLAQKALPLMNSK